MPMPKPGIAKSKYLTKLLVADLSLHIKEKPEFEYKFHPVRRWRLDIAYVISKFAIEIHGGIWSDGRHTRGLGFKGDREKMNTASELGWTVHECITDDIETGKACDDIVRHYCSKIGAESEFKSF